MCNKDELVEVPFDDKHTAIIPKSFEKHHLDIQKEFEKQKENKFKPVFYPWYGK